MPQLNNLSPNVSPSERSASGCRLEWEGEWDKLVNCPRHASGLSLQLDDPMSKTVAELNAAKSRQKTCSESRTNATCTLTHSLSHSVSHSLTHSLSHSLRHSLRNRFSQRTCALSEREFPWAHALFHSLAITLSRSGFDGEHGQIQAAFAFELRPAKGQVRAVRTVG